MTTFIVITTLISVLLSAGVTLKQLHLSWKNQELRDAVMSTVGTITKQLKDKRLDVGKLISALQVRNNAALANYLYLNPAVSKSLAEIQADSGLIADLQNEATNLESQISNLESEIQSLGYSQSHQGTDQERQRYAEKKRELDKTVSKYDDLSKKVKDTRMTAYRDFKVDTSHLDAVTQNIAGGMKNVQK